jgi:hypothetical protein
MEARASGMDLATVTSVRRPSADWRPVFVACRFLCQAVTVTLGVALGASPLQAQGADAGSGAPASADNSAAKEPGAAAEEDSFPLIPGDWLRERDKLKDIGIKLSFKRLLRLRSLGPPITCRNTPIPLSFVPGRVHTT